MLPAAVGAAAALLALSTLGLTWVRRSVQGPLGEASAAQVEALSGRDVAPVVAALVPGLAAAAVVALLLRGWWRAGALGLAALAGTGAAVAAVAVLLPGGAGPGGGATATPGVAAVACLVAAAGALAGAVRTVRARPAVSPELDDGSAPPAGAAPAAAGRLAGSAAGSEADPTDLWRALDDGRDPT